MGGGGMEVDLSHGAVAAMSRQAEGLRPVLQLADVPRLVGSLAERYRLVLSDGVRSQQGVLVTSLNRLVTAGALRRGTIIRVLDYICCCIQNQRVIIVIQLEILQTVCTLIGCPTFYEANAMQRDGVSCSGDLGSHEPCFVPGAQQGVNNSSCVPGQGMLYSSIDSPLCITPINALNPYQAGWKIKARVTVKTDLRHFNNAKGHGKVFSCDLLDAQGGEVRATCFNLLADRYFDLIEVDKVYLISKGLLKPALKKFNPLNNDYEILVDHTTSIEICSGDDSSIPRQQYNFRQISEIENMETGAIVDLVGIVTSVGPSATIMRKDGSEAQRRTLQLKDMSGQSVKIIFWGKFCDAEGQQLQLLCGSGSNPILALKGGHIIDLCGRSVDTNSSTRLKVNPDFSEAERLRQWYMTEGKTARCVSLSREISSMSQNHVRKTVAQIRDENLGRSDKPDLITVKAVISHVNADAFCYPACTLELSGKRCKRKVTKNGDATWYCDRCAQSSEDCEYRYLLICQIKDHTGTIYATAFQDAGEDITGHTAQELFMIRNVEQDDARFEEIMEAVVQREYIFKLRIKEETFKGEQRVKCNIVAVEKLDASNMNHPVEEIDNLMKDLSRSTLEDALSYIPNIGSANLEARQSMQTSSNANGSAISVDGAGCGNSTDQIWLQASGYGRMSTPLSGLSESYESNGGFVD